MTEQQAQRSNENDLLWRHLKTVPAFRALLRAVEARFYRHIDIPGPTLDLGCGDGHFAAMAFDHPLAAGADPWWGPLRKAQAAGVYRLNVQAMGHRLPFPNNHFASVISNSVLEHIPDVQPVLAEAGRVLQPDGKLVVTMPSHLFTTYLGGASLLRPLGLDNTYRRFFNTISRHAHTDPPELWCERLAHAGFRITRWQYYFSRGALRALELGHVQGLPSAILHFLTGHWILAPWPDSLRPTERWVRPFYEESPPDEGAYLFIVAQKVADSAIAPFLPPADPLPVDEPLASEQMSASTQAQPAPPPTLAPPPVAGSTASGTRSPAHPSMTTAGRSAEPAPSPTTTEAQPRGDFARLLLLALGLFLAYLGQNALEGAGLVPGLSLYGLALLALAGAVRYARGDRSRPVTDDAGPFPRQRLLYPVALLLALWAQNQSNVTLFGGHPLAAFLSWFLAIGVGAYALVTPRTEGGKRDDSMLGPESADASHSLHEIAGAASWLARPALLAVLLFIVALFPRLIAVTDHPAMLNGIEASLGLEALSVLRGEIRNPFAVSWLTNPTLPLFPMTAPLALLGRSVLGLRLVSIIAGTLTVPALYLIGRRLWGEVVALSAALLLAGYHFHIHYSRLGTTNAWDPLLALLALGTVGIAFHRSTRQSWLLAGLMTGLTAYFFTPSRLMPFFLLALLVYLLLLKPAFFRKQGRHALAGLALALVVALPQLVFFNANPGLYMERANTLGILQSGWLPQQMASSGRSALALLGQQLADAFLAFNATLDTSSAYNPGIPLLRTLPALLFVVGAAVSVARLRQLAYALLLIWLSVTLVFAGALLVDAPDSHRLLIAAPAAILMVAIGLAWLWQQVSAALRARSTDQSQSRLQARLIAGTLLLAALIAAGDLLFYFGEYRTSSRFGDRNTEVAYEMGRYLQSLNGSWTAYFHGPPNMYISFPTIPFLAGERFQAQHNLFDVSAGTDAPLQDAAPVPGSDLVFIFLPERSSELNQMVERFPDGSVLTFDGAFASPLFYAYEVQR